MKLLDRYVLCEWLKVFLLAMLVTIGLILLEDMYNELQGMLEQGASLKDIYHYYVALTPSFFPIIVPLALLVSLLFSLGQMHRNHEITAMRAAGLNVFKITRTLWLASLILTLFLTYLNAKHIPQAIEKARTFRENLSFSKLVQKQEENNIGVVYNLSFDNRSSGRLWFINRYSQYSQKAFGINVYLQEALGNERQRIMAKEGYFDKEKKHWVMKKGRNIVFDLEGDPIESKPFKKAIFPDLKESPELMMALKKHPQDLSYLELNMLIANVSKEDNPKIQAYMVNKHKILAAPFSCIIITAVAIPFVLGGVRVNPMIGISKTIALIFVYHFLMVVCTMMGGQQFLPAFVAAWLPNLVVLFVAGYFYTKSY